MAQEPPVNESLPAMVRGAIQEARTLARLEIALAKLEMKREVGSAKRAGVAFGAATVLAIAGLTLWLVSLALAFSPTWLPALLVGTAALATAGVIALVGYKAAPKQPLGEE